MVSIAIFTRKGGVGKTSTTINLAGCLDVVFGRKILVIDCDAQNNTTAYLTAAEETEPEKTIMNLFDEKKDYESILHKVRVYDRKDEHLIDTNITLVPGSPETDNIETDDVYGIKKLLEAQKDNFDFCFMDCPPALTEMTLNALAAADYVIIPAQSGRDSVNGYSMVVNEIDRMKENGYNPNIKVLGALLNAVDTRRSIDNYYRDEVWGENSNVIFKSTIRNSADVKNANEFGKPLHYYRPNCNVAIDYERLCLEIITKVKQ